MADEPLWTPGTPAQAKWLEIQVAGIIDGLNAMLARAARQPPHNHEVECKRSGGYSSVEDASEGNGLKVEDDTDDDDDDEGLAGV